ncbi:STAS domain-containing protein [Streptomyces sp. NPDC002564]|uniref:STAS domain-containing protein n=1 Tax=Streptomyces sp. NPDC002564 TaxID=3364649 RepID=UPI0036C65E51
MVASARGPVKLPRSTLTPYWASYGLRDPDGPGRLHVDHAPARSCHPSHLRGEIDVLTAPELTGALLLTLQPQRPDLLIDLRPVTFIDTSGLTALALVRHRAVTRGGRARLICTHARTLWMLGHPRLGFGLEVLPAVPDTRSPCLP